MRDHVTRGFSPVLFRYTVRSNRILMLVILLVFCLFTVATNMAASLLVTDSHCAADAEDQKIFFTYLGAMAAYNAVTGADLSYDGFASDPSDSRYDDAFAGYNASAPEGSIHLDRAGLEETVQRIRQTDTDPGTLVRMFEYQAALQGQSGIFTGTELSTADLVSTMLESMGVSMEDMERMQEMDLSVMITRVYYTAMGALILFLFVIIAANALIAGPVDRGSMAYFLSAPNRRSAVALTQLVYLVVIPLGIILVGGTLRIVSTQILFGEVCVPRLLCLFLGMYIMVEAIAGICFLCSCIFNDSGRALGIGGGFAVWCFLASLLGMFGTKDLLDMGIGVEALGIFNKLTLISLFDINAIQTIGTGSVDTSFVPKLAILLIIAAVTYAAGVWRFERKDLPL